MITTQEIWTLYGKYVDAWKAISDEEQTKIIDEVFTEDIQYFTPEFQGGREAIIQDMAGFRKKYPGGYFEVEDISAHHDVALLTWVLVNPDGNILAKGHDQIRISSEGKIAGLITFAPSVSKP
jgi:hypothetical protein